MRKILIITLLLTLLLPNTVYAITLPDGVPQSIMVNGKTLDLNENIAKAKGYVVYGTYADVPGNEQKQGQYRYLGYDMNKNYFSNKDFPNDDDSGRAAYQKDWIQYPWDQGLCKPSRYNSDPKASQWLDTLNWPNWPGTTLKDYLKIQSAPYEYAPGSAEGWHQNKNKTVWYQTFELEPEKKVTITENKKPGGMYDQDEQRFKSRFAVFRYIHEKKSGGQVTFRIYKFSTYEDSTITSFYEKPSDAVLCKEQTVNFPASGGEWSSLTLKVDRPPIGVEQGFYITSSESNFEKGVIVSFLYQKDEIATSGGIYGTCYIYKYKPDDNTVGYFDNLGIGHKGTYNWQKDSNTLEVSTPGGNNPD